MGKGEGRGGDGKRREERGDKEGFYRRSGDQEKFLFLKDNKESFSRQEKNNLLIS
jgi:hypothetical protein